MKTVIELIIEEREKQISKHGFTAEHHFNHPEWYDKNQLITAANILSIKEKTPCQVPENWDIEWFQRLCDKPYKKRLIIAATLIVAEFERISYESESQYS